jgi:hypothetical protein
VYFAGLVFAQSFARATTPGSAIGANMLGAVVGGWAEYASMALGIRALGCSRSRSTWARFVCLARGGGSPSSVDRPRGEPLVRPRVGDALGRDPRALGVARGKLHALELARVVRVAREHEVDVARARAPQRLDREIERGSAPFISSAVPVASAAARRRRGRARSAGGRRSCAPRGGRSCAPTDPASRSTTRRVCAARSSSKWSCTEARHQSKSARNSAS